MKTEPTTNERVLEVIARNYDQLYWRCYDTVPAYNRTDFEDIFEDCILFMSRDERAVGLTSEQDIIELFVYRFRMIEFGWSHWKQGLKEVNIEQFIKSIDYANYIQAQRKEDERE